MLLHYVFNLLRINSPVRIARYEENGHCQCGLVLSFFLTQHTYIREVHVHISLRDTGSFSESVEYFIMEVAPKCSHHQQIRDLVDFRNQ